jgi:hypothetical protein
VSSVSQAYPRATRYNPRQPFYRTVPLALLGVQLDPSTPVASASAGIGTSIVSNAFIPPDNSLVVVFAAVGWSSTARPTMTCTDSLGNVWENPARAYGNTNNGGGVAAFRHYFTSSPGSITVTINYSNFTAGGGRFVDTLVFTGANQDQSSAATGTSVTSTGTDGTILVTTTQPGSWVWGVSDDATSNTTWAPNGNSILDVTDSAGPTDSVTIIGWRGTGLTSATGPTTFGGTWGAVATSNQVGLEILPVLATSPASTVIQSGQMLLFM